MEYDKNIAQLFILNFNEAYRSAKLLLMSCNRIASLMPLNAEAFNAFEADNLDKLDAFRVRYCDLQDTLRNKIFRTLLLLEEEQPLSNLDTLNKMEKRGILSSFEEWKKQKNIRNLFTRDYPATDEEKLETLNLAYLNSFNLIKTLDNVIDYLLKTLAFL